jgi:hypothetical protein
MMPFVPAWPPILMRRWKNWSSQNIIYYCATAVTERSLSVGQNRPKLATFASRKKEDPNGAFDASNLYLSLAGIDFGPKDSARSSRAIVLPKFFAASCMSNNGEDASQSKRLES